MISPHTPPGTLLVVCWTGDVITQFDVVSAPYRNFARLAYELGHIIENDFKVGQRFTLANIEPEETCACGFCLNLVERPGSFALDHFEVAALPDCLTSLLVGRRVPEAV